MWKIFLDENPNCSYEDLVSAFGPPEIFAREMLGTLDRKELKQAQSRYKWFLRGTAILVAVLTIIFTFWFSTGQGKIPQGGNDPNSGMLIDPSPELEDGIVFSWGKNMPTNGRP